MTPSTSVAAALAVLSFAPTLAAQSFSYADFSTPTSLTRLGSAVQSGNVLQLTANVSDQTGWAWHQTRMPVIAGFDTTFTFRITGQTGTVWGEGMALVIHDDPNGLAATGGTGFGLGYGAGVSGSPGIRNSIAIEVDTLFQGFDDFPLLSIHTRGPQGNHESEQYSLGIWSSPSGLASGQPHTLRVRYTPGTLELFFDGAASPQLTRAFDLIGGGTYLNGQPAPAPAFANGTAFVGFSAATEANPYIVSHTHLTEVLSWQWTSTPVRDACYAGSIGEDLLTVDGSAGATWRTVRLATYQPFTIGIGSAAAVGPGAPFVLVLSLWPQPGALGTALGFGDTCMPVLPFGPAELVFADSFGLFSALLPSGPAPFEFPLPVGVVTFPLDFTLQAVTVASLNPLELGVTNAIDVEIAPSAGPVISAVSMTGASGGQTVTITGQRFVPGFALTLSGAPVVPTSSSGTQIVLPLMAAVACDAPIVVTNPDGQQAIAALNPTPTATGVILGSGPAAGNQDFYIQGSGFAAGSTVTIGGAPALVLSVAATLLRVRTPPGTPGPAIVVITTPGGCQAITTYTYL